MSFYKWKALEAVTDRGGRVDETKLALITTLATATIVVIYMAITRHPQALEFFQVYLLMGGGLTVTKGAATTIQKRGAGKEEKEEGGA